MSSYFDTPLRIALDKESPRQSLGPEVATEQSDVLRAIDKIIYEVLTERQRTALVSAVIHGVSYEEVAAQMNTSVNALYKVIHDARVKMRRCLEDQGLSLDYVIELFGRS